MSVCPGQSTLSISSSNNYQQNTVRVSEFFFGLDNSHPKNDNVSIMEGRNMVYERGSEKD